MMTPGTHAAQEATLTNDVRQVLLDHQLNPNLATREFIEIVQAICGRHLERAMRKVRMRVMEGVVLYMARESMAGRL